MLNHIDIHNILFLDIETVPGVESFEELSPNMQKLWDGKTKYQRGECSPAEFWEERGGIMAEFSKIVCISVGFIPRHNQGSFRVKSFFGDNEKQLLEEFAEMLNNYFNTPNHLLCAHNGKEFDFPVIARRMLINGVALPAMLDIAGKKPWEIKHLDTMELWKFGDYKHFTSIKLLTEIFGIPSPKDDIDGSEVARVYYKEQDLPRIVTYCEKDTLAVAQVMMKYKRLPLLEMEQVE